MKLYEITNNYERAFALLADSEDDDLTIAAIDTIEAVEGEFELKLLNCAAMVKNFEAESDAIKQAIDSMKKRKESLDKKADQLKNYMLANMQKTGIKQAKNGYLDVELAKCPPSVEVIDMDSIPNLFIRVKEIREIDKQAIKSAGGCHGAMIVQKERVSIK